MNYTYDRELILSLIKDDLIHARLMLGLNRMGLETETYVIGLGETVFRLLKIKDDEHGEALFEYYIKLRTKVMRITVNEWKGLDALVQEIWEELTVDIG